RRTSGRGRRPRNARESAQAPYDHQEDDENGDPHRNQSATATPVTPGSRGSSQYRAHDRRKAEFWYLTVPSLAGDHDLFPSKRGGPERSARRALDHELPEQVRGVEPAERIGRLLERKGRVHDRAQPSGSEVGEDLLELPARRHRATADGGLSPEQGPHVQLHLRSRARPDHDDPARPCERPDRPGEGGGAYRIQDDIDAVLFAPLPQGPVERSLVREREEGVGPEGAYLRLLGRGPRDHRDVRAEELRDLHGRGGDASPRADHRYALARTDLADRLQGPPGGQEHERGGGPFRERHPLGQRVHIASRDDRVGRDGPLDVLAQDPVVPAEGLFAREAGRAGR